MPRTVPLHHRPADRTAGHPGGLHRAGRYRGGRRTMTANLRANATLAYLVAVLLFGGTSAGGLGANLFLQLLGAGLIGWTLIATAGGERLHTGLRPFFMAVAVLGAVQFLPLPPGLW